MIKYRCWDIILREFLNPEEFAMTGDGDIMVVEGYEWNRVRNNNLYILQLCSGLKDRFGKDIYEGDFIQVDNEAPDLVEFRDGCFWVDDLWLYDYCSEPGHCEIVGNVFNL